MWWLDPDEHVQESIDETLLPWNQQICTHDWKPILLLVSTVYDCSKCKIKKEEYDKWKKSKGL